MSERDPHDYTIEVCAKPGCGAQLDRSGNGRCPVSRDHWREGGMVVRVVARRDGAQETGRPQFYRPNRVPAKAQVVAGYLEPGGEPSDGR